MNKFGHLNKLMERNAVVPVLAGLLNSNTMPFPSKNNFVKKFFNFFKSSEGFGGLRREKQIAHIENIKYMFFIKMACGKAH